LSDNPQLPAGPGELPVRTGNQGGTGERIVYAHPQSEIAVPRAAPDFWQIFRRRKGTLILMAFLGGLAGLLLSLPQTPIYQAETTVEIQSINENLLNTRQLDPSAGDGYVSMESTLETQIRILQSESLIERVVEKLKIGQGAAAFEEPSRLSAWRKALGLPRPEPISSRERAVALAAGSVRVQALGRARILRITCDSTDPFLAKQFVDTLANEFIENNIEARWKATRRTGEWLTRQLDELKINLEKSEDQLQSYAATAGLLFTSEKDKESVAEQRLRQVQAELSVAFGERVAKQSKYEIANSSAPESLPEVLDDGSLRDTQSKLQDLRRQLAELSPQLKPAHYKIERLEAQIAELQAAFEKDRGNIIKRIFNEYQAALRREKALSTEAATQARVVSEQARKGIHYNILKREVDTNRQLYDAMLQKVKEYGIASAMHASNVRILDAAKVPEAPYKPDVRRHAILGLLVGVAFGCLLVLRQEQTDPKIQVPGDASLQLNVHEFGVIPAASSDPGLKLPKWKPQRAISSGGHDSLKLGNHRNGDNRIEMIAWDRRFSLMAESFRGTLASILFSGYDGDVPRVILFTSSSPGEGKSTIVSNLGITMAAIKRRVVLIDADLRGPRLHKIFDVGRSPGLVDLLQRETTSTDLMPWLRRTEVPNLSVLPSGSDSAALTNLFYSPRMTELLRRLGNEFDAVLIDSPPMLAIPDARVLGRLADGVILVLRSGRTTTHTARASCERLLADGTRFLGTILNDWDPRKHRGYGYYKESYHTYYANGKPDQKV
jgi:succinoglycan biosynthesis transport protein ExoP